MPMREGWLPAQLATPPRVTIPLRRATGNSFGAHNLTLPSGLSPITGGHSPATALDDSDPDAFLRMSVHAPPSPRKTTDDVYYRPHPRRPPPTPTRADAGSEGTETEGEGVSTHEADAHEPRLSQALRGPTHTATAPVRASALAPPSAYLAHTRTALPASNTGLNTSPSPARSSVPQSASAPAPCAGSSRPRTAPPPPADSVDGLEQAQTAANEAQDRCTLSRAKALEEESALREALEEEARLAAEVQRLELLLQGGHETRAEVSRDIPHRQGGGEPFIYEDLARSLRTIAGPLDTPSAGARAQQRWEATHVPLPGTFSSKSPHEKATLSPKREAALEAAVDHRYRLSKLVVALDEERQKTAFLRARHRHLVEAYRQLVGQAPHEHSPPSPPEAARESGSSASRLLSEEMEERTEDHCDCLDDHDDVARHRRVSAFCGSSESPRKPPPLTLSRAPVPLRTQDEVAEDLAQMQRNLADIRALASSHRTTMAAVAGAAAEQASHPPQSGDSESQGTAPEDAVESDEASEETSRRRTALAENGTLRRQLIQLVHAGEEEVMSLLEYYQLLLARLAQRTEAALREWKATSEPPPIPSEGDDGPAEQRSRLVSWF